MTEQRNGRVVTFYSFKGGTGRTMALANVAWILAANGKRVLVADWDLESPGLHRFFAPFIRTETVETTGGVIDMVREYEWQTTRTVERGPGWQEQFARSRKYAFSLDWDHFQDGGQLDFLSAGRQNQQYAASLTGMNWDDFYEQLGGGAFFDALRKDMQNNYDYTLIDSRTGLSDVADICTIHLPDILVDCFTFSEQGIAGAARVATSIGQNPSRPDIRVLPVPMRVDPAEKEKADAGRAFAMQLFPGLPAGMAPADRTRYWNAVEVPYRPYYAYEEILSTFGDPPGQTTSMLAAFERLTEYITDGEVRSLPVMDEALRTRTVSRFTRRVSLTEEEVTLEYAPEDLAWAEWIGALLSAAGLQVHDANGSTDDTGSGGTRLTLVSHANRGARTDVVPRDRTGTRPPLAIYLDDLAPLSAFRSMPSAFIAGKSSEVAMDRILRLVGLTADDVDAQVIGVRFPGEPPAVFNPLARNARFTGREADLRDLRAQLRGGQRVVLSGLMPVALQGMGGIGKTQIALEYAHRFRNAYDVVWWIDADQAEFIDIALSDLGNRLELPLPQSGVLDVAKAVIAALEQGAPHARWLIVFDNAENVNEVLPFIPGGRGHVLITSRNNQWGEFARPVLIDVFERRESVAHLRQRVGTVRIEQADRIAESLGDLPIAVAAAGAWLAETGEQVDEYLRRVEQKGPDRTIDEVWDLSLGLLQKRSGAAYRLLQLCSVLAPEISLDLVYSDELATVLSRYDPLVSERDYRATLVQHINRLALLKLDVGRSQLQVHRLLQHVVRNRMNEQELVEARHEIHLVLAGLRPRYEIDDSRSWGRFRMLWPHLELSRATSCDEELVRQLMIDRVRYLWYTGGLIEGRQLGEQIDRRWSEMLHDVPEPAKAILRRQILHLRFNVANIMRQMAQFEDARALDEAVLNEQLDLLGPTHPHTLMTAGGLGGDLRALGRYAAAGERDELTYATWVEHFGEDSSRTLSALSNLATTQRLAGDFRAARARDQELWERNKRINGETHARTLGTGTNLGRDLREAGEYRRSVELLEDIARQYEEVFGPTSHRTLSARANWAVSLNSAGHSQPAARLLEDAYEQLNEVVGPTNPDTLACRLSRAVSLLAIEEISTAISELNEVRLAYGSNLGQRHPHTLVCLNNLGAAHRADGDLVKALDFVQRAADGLTKVLGPIHPYSLAARLNLGVLHAETGEVAVALEMIEPLMQMHRDVLGPDHPDTLRCAANQALMRKAAGRAAAEDGDVMERLVAVLGEHHPAVAALYEDRYLHRLLDPHPF